MKSARKGDIVWYETKGGRRRLALVTDVLLNNYPPFARVRPYIGGRQAYGGQTKVPLTAIMRRASAAVRADVDAGLNASAMILEA